MVTVSTVVGIAYLTTGITLLFFLRKPLQHPQKPGSLGFGLAVVGISLWPLSLGVNYFVTDLGLSMALWNLRLLAAAIISVGWFTVALSITTGKQLSRRLLLPLAVYVLIGQAIAWTNPWHHLVLQEGTTTVGAILVPVDGTWFWVQTAINYGLIVGSTALLAAEWLRSTGMRSKQMAVLTIAVVPPIAANVVTIFGVVDTVHDLTPFGLIGSGVLLSWALYRVGFLDVVPVAREIAMANMGDAVVTLDGDDRVIDCNPAAEALFDPPADYVGRPAAEFFEAIPDDVLARYADAEDVDTEFSATIDGAERYFSLTISPVRERGETIGRVLVIHDVTTMRRREQALAAREAELDLLQQVLGRVLRHNIRNELVAIQGNATEIKRHSEDAYATERSDEILAASEALLEKSEKAREIERIVDSDDAGVVVDLRTVADSVVATQREAYPDVSFSVEGASECRVRTVPGFETAVSYLVENAAEYNDAADPTVTVRVDDATAGGPRVSVADNGPGIPEHEIEILQANEETPLSHGSGIGLWLVKWTADASDATLSFETSDEGTTASITFDASVDPSDEPEMEATDDEPEMEVADDEPEMESADDEPEMDAADDEPGTDTADEDAPDESAADAVADAGGDSAGAE
jgi:PAS domain S-box-containing protein